VRILLVANTLPPRDLSGVGEQVLQLASGLRECGCEVEILGRGEEGAWGPKLLFPLSVVPVFLRRLREYRPHVVQVHESDGALVALIASVLAPFCDPVPLLSSLLQVSYVNEFRVVRPIRFGDGLVNRPSAAEQRFRWLKSPLQIVLGCLTAWLAEASFAPSEATAREIEHDYRVSPVRVIPNVTGGLNREPAGSTRSVEVESDYLLFVGRLRIRKGVGVLLSAMSRLVPDHPSIRLLIAGDGEQRHSLERMRRRYALEQHVHFLGRCAPAEVGSLLRGARALVVPSIYEGMPLVVLEAMGHGVPVVASGVSGIPEVVVDGSTGWLVPPGDAIRLGRVLADVLDNEVEARKRGDAGRRRLTELYRPAVAAGTWLRWVENALGSRSGGGGPREGRGP
jgi:glycosyltransferase involved in cell wall biosynthesis